jgi:hypothetical protein
MTPSDSSPYAPVELVDEQSCRWNEADVPLAERGVRFTWLLDFVGSICWRQNEAVRQRLRWEEEARLWDEHEKHSLTPMPPKPAHLDHTNFLRPVEFYEPTVHELVARHIIPLTNAIRAPLYARIPSCHRGKPGVFLSHAWANSVLSSTPRWHGGTLDAFDKKGIAGIKDEFVWIDFVSYNQHKIADERIAFDMEATISSIGKVAFAVTPTPLFDRIWCLWEVLSASTAEAKMQFCTAAGYRTDKRVMVNQFVEAFKSINEARATKVDDHEKLLSAMIARFGSVAAADEHIRGLMRGGMGHPWFELYR